MDGSDRTTAFHLSHRIREAFSNDPAFDLAVPNDDDGTITVYLRAESAQLRRAIESVHPGRVRFEVLGEGDGWYAYTPPR